MKFRFAIIASLTVLLAACNFTLAQDVTPPPGYVPPTPAATLGPLYPAQAPSIENGAVIYAEKCAACHGTTGLGDGEQGIQLNVTVPAFGLPEIARPASPAQWFITVTRGNIERFMPPFVSLSDQERWDVVAYAMMFHISEEELAKGKELFETNCAQCSTDFFTDQSKMAELSEVELARIAREGNDQVPAFGATLTEEELWAVTAYLRTLSFDTAPIAAAPASTLPPTEAGTLSAEETPLGTEQASAGREPNVVANQGVGNVSGSIENKTGTDLPSDLKVTLRGYDHGADPSAGPQEVFSQEAAVNETGSFVFENVEIPLNRIFVAELTYEGMDLKSGFAIVKEGDISVTVPPITLYNKTTDASRLVIDEARIFLEYGANDIQVFNAYAIRNSGDEIVVVATKEKNAIPIFTSPQGSAGLGYELMQGNQNLQTDSGLFFPPGETPYELLTIASMPKAKEFEFSQEFVLPAAMVTIFVPEGVTVKSTQAADLGVQNMQGFSFQIYDVGSVSAGEKVQLTISGTPKEASAAAAPAETTSNQNLLIGAGALGIGLILAGGWMYLRDRNREAAESDEEDEELGSSEDVIDAIIALDDLHRAKKISDEAYQKRRAELKEFLKGKM